MKRVAWFLLFCAACAPDFAEPWQADQPRLMGVRVEVEGDAARPRPRIDQKFDLRFYVSLPAGAFPSPLATRYGFATSLCLGYINSSGILACLGEQLQAPTVTPVSDNEVLVSGMGLDLAALAGGFGISPDQLGQADVGDAGSFDLLRTVDRLAVIGVFCVDGDPVRDPGKSATTSPPSELYRCNSRPEATYKDATTFALSVYFERGLPTDPNRNPSFACDSADPSSVCNTGTRVDQEAVVPGAFVIARPTAKKSKLPREVVAWPARDPSLGLPWDACASDPTLVQVRAKSGEHVLRVRFDPSDREAYQYVVPFNGQDQLRSGREALLLTHAVTLHAGDLARFDSKLDDTDPDDQAEISVRWTPPDKGDDVATITENGRLVRFYFTLRDERGGVDFATRELCLLPAAP